MNGDFVLLTEKVAMWAELLMAVLRDNDMPIASMPVHGAGFSMSTGTPERLKIYVPTEKLDEARDLMEELFPEDDEQA